MGVSIGENSANVRYMLRVQCSQIDFSINLPVADQVHGGEHLEDLIVGSRFAQRIELYGGFHKHHSHSLG